jgi:hypothetical protein
MASALINRLIHIHLRASTADWFLWAGEHGIHPWIIDYLTERPDQLWSQAPKTEEAFSTPRSWHMLSDALHSWGSAPDGEILKVLAAGTLSPSHAAGFCGWVKIVQNSYGFEAVLKGDAAWPSRPQDRDLLYFLAEAFRARLVKELPASKDHGSANAKRLAFRAKALLVELAEISLEIAQTVIADDEDGNTVLPSWFLVEAARDLPRLVAARG